MLKWTLVVTAIVFAQHSLASNEHDAYFKAMSAQENFTIEMDAASDVSDIINKRYADKCENFAGDGEVKKWGLIVEKELDKDRQRALYDGPKDVKVLCPPYTKLSDEDKKGLWILIVSAMTHYESSCIFTEKAKGPNGIAAGLLQLHRGKEARYSNGCRNGDSATPERSLICGISMINDQIERGEPLFSPRSYWEVLRPKGRSQKTKRIMSVIGQYPACRVKTEAKIKKRNSAAPTQIGTNLTK